MDYFVFFNSSNLHSCVIGEQFGKNKEFLKLYHSNFAVLYPTRNCCVLNYNTTNLDIRSIQCQVMLTYQASGMTR
ncbi:hypothetical protein BD779DRAFT_1495214 [Infundibulicybe gibba]|nr:hypothetical protein BD779DRAFT_1495214 [Infundibulicybe gibba]